MDYPPTTPPTTPGALEDHAAPPDRGLLLLIAGAVLCATPWASPGFALALGAGLAVAGLVSGGPIVRETVRRLIQASVVLLGFSMDLGQVARAGAAGILFAAATIVGVFALGAVLSRWLRTDAKLTALLSAGTAICGGSAIAAAGSVIAASGTQMSVALGTVFVLNGAALYIFPALGHALGLTHDQFGMWAGVAIHDVSSVVGAAAHFGPASIEPATAVKLSRVLWIVPIVAALGWRWSRESASGPAGAEQAGRRGWAAAIPWFVGLFLAAAAIRSIFPDLAEAAPQIKRVATGGMTVALFLVGAGLSRSALASVGWRALVMGIALWVATAGATLAVVMCGGVV